MCVGCVGIERKIEPLVAEAERCRRRNVDGVRYVTIGNGRSVQVNITHAMIVASTHRAAHVPAVQRVETDVERCTSPCVPVAVDVLRPRDASTRCFVVSDNSTDGIARALEAGIGAEAPVALCLRNGIAQAVFHIRRTALHLEVCAQIGRERRFQSRVTHVDAQRVGIVVDVEQLCDAGLACRPTECHLQIGLLIETIAHVERRRDVGHRANGIDRYTKILLHEV